MMCIILLLINLTSCVCGTFVVNVTQTSYQAEENHNITLEWMFTTKTGSSLHSLYIYCELLTDLRASVLFRLHGGVEVPESQDEQFTGRVQCDKDVLREGRLRLHVSRLRTDDSGLYMCDVSTHYGGSAATCPLNVTGLLSNLQSELEEYKGPKVSSWFGEQWMDSKGEVSREAEEYGNERLPPAGGSARLFTAQQDTAIENMVLENNAITLKQIQRKVIEDQVVFQTINSVSLSTLDRVLRHNAVRMKQVYRVPF
ncbi:hypothetical protein ABVT39_025002 [Epinephelus coioides]